MPLINLSWVFTAYLCLSFLIFLATSNTMLGWILYLFLLLPFFGFILLVWWLFAWQNRNKTARVKFWVWSIVLGLQVATIVVSPGNCYGFSQGNTCYSNFQILAGQAPPSGPSDAPHWKPIEDAFPGLLMAYGVAVLVGMVSTAADVAGHQN
uniref:Uncharacterized protein n=1 Tax=Cyanothece sp. (strain PCC 7425 / ATCC 29141) TaxID=395961 RepID=B8HTT9_CYAP4